jgi:hypothetical protein
MAATSTAWIEAEDVSELGWGMVKEAREMGKEAREMRKGAREMRKVWQARKMTEGREAGDVGDRKEWPILER